MFVRTGRGVTAKACGGQYDRNSCVFFIRHLDVTSGQQLLSIDDGHVDGNLMITSGQWRQNKMARNIRISQNQNPRKERTTAGLIDLISLHRKASDPREAVQTVSKGAPSGDAKALAMPLKIERMARAPETIPKGS